MVKDLPAMQETQVWSLGLDDPLKKEMATLSSILAEALLDFVFEDTGRSEEIAAPTWKRLQACSTVGPWQYPGLGLLKSEALGRLGADPFIEDFQVPWKRRVDSEAHSCASAQRLWLWWIYGTQKHMESTAVALGDEVHTCSFLTEPLFTKE